MKTRNVDLVRPDNEAYREQSAEYAQASMHLRDTLDPGPLERLSGPVEELLRQWLSEQLPLTERRILRYEVLQKNGSYDLRFKEIDAVEASDPDSAADEWRPRRLFEMKCSSNVSTLASAGGQLQQALRPIRARWGDPVFQHAMLVAVVPDVMDLPDPPTALDAFDPALPADANPDTRLETVLAADDLWAWGQATDRIGPDGPIEAEPDLLEAAQEKARSTIQKRRRREELREQGVPREEWPDDLTTNDEEDVPDPETVQYGAADENDEEEDSAMAQALRDALDEDDQS
jgi:hypothetical protein